MVKRIVLASILVISLTLTGLIAGIATGQNRAGDYDFSFGITIDNNSGEAVSGLVPFEIDSSLLGTSSFVNSSFTDVFFADSSDASTNGMVEDVTANDAIWWIDAESIPANMNVTEHVYTSGPAEEKYFPLNASNLTGIAVDSTSTLEIDDSLVMTATVESNTCGTILGKQNLDTEEDAAGYGMYSVGLEDFPGWQGSLQGVSQYVFYDITPLENFWICGAGTGFSDPSLIERIRIEEDAESEIVLDTVPVYLPDTQNTQRGSAVLFKDIALLEEGKTYHIYFDGSTSMTFARQVVFGSGFPALMDVDGNVATFEQPSSTLSFDGNTYRAAGFQVDDSFSATGIVGRYSPGVLYTHATSTETELEIAINCNVIPFSWTGARAELQVFYSTSSGEMTLKANGFPLSFPFPSCQAFGNKQGGDDVDTNFLANYESSGVQRLAGSLFTPPVSGTLQAINAKLRWDRGGNGTDAAMSTIVQAALYDSSKNLVDQTLPLDISLPHPDDTQVQTYRMEFEDPPDVATSSSYYLMVWADNIEVDATDPSSFVGANNTFSIPQGYEDRTQEEEVVRFCNVDESDLIAFANEEVFLEAARVYFGNVSAGSKFVVGIYQQDTGDDWDLLEAATGDIVSNGYATVQFDGTTLLDPSNENYRIAFLTDEDGAHTAPYIAHVSATGQTAGGETCAYQVDSPDYPSLDTTVDMESFTATSNGGNSVWGIDIPPGSGTGEADKEVLVWGIQVGRFVQDIELHPTTLDDSGSSIEYDNSAYDASFPDPFTSDDSDSGKVAVIWGDVTASTTDKIATTTDDIVIGNGLTGRIDEVSISDVGPQLYFKFEPGQISNTQEGNSSNDWLWKGTIEDQQGDNDGTYSITSDLSGIEITALPLGAAAVAVPVPDSGFPNIYGNPDLVTPATPIPTTSTDNPIVEEIKDSIEGNDIRPETVYIFLTSFILALISSLIMKVLPHDFIPWLIGITGFAILAQFAGQYFLVTWVILYGLQATGLMLTIRFAR